MYIQHHNIIVIITVWAAKVPSVPVQMAVTSFGNQKGLIVTIDDTGTLSVSYLGDSVVLRCEVCSVVVL